MLAAAKKPNSEQRGRPANYFRLRFEKADRQLEFVSGVFLKSVSRNEFAMLLERRI